MIELLPSPFDPKLEEFLSTLDSSCFICSPYITANPVQRLISTAEQKAIADTITIKVVTDISAGNLVQGSTDIQALILLMQRVRNVEITYLPKVHAKVYVSGETKAIISSANFTGGGLFTNFEYGVQINEPTLVRQVKADITQYAGLGSAVTVEQLSGLHNRVEQLRSVIQDDQRSINRKVRSLSAELQRETEEDLIRVRTRERTTHAIFAETILYLLSRRSLTTIELNTAVQEIHPDLCDDSVDRIIDGRHFGKFWKHEVRTAQKHLKRKGAVSYNPDTRLWKKS